ncbi:hypothetical protein GCM10025879_18770 [Leuconostoc litchii]|uniref:Uncharacterized protein n=1 Tax=Leuconostoc litchii TaxID=1981069 RepID=A0A6P2CR63_9LACO|nr:hypothetical protein [Leuconostoc litchii]TYC46749.1 hypothetical protein ESZ47_01010 [Leuconostoc litchii]GMA70631.1 hypothetical protein GCM10025879_18770 [Leuconostoc litchii]
MANNTNLLLLLICTMAFTSTEKYKNSKFYGYILPYRGIVLITVGICIAIYAVLNMPIFPALVIPIVFILLGVIDFIKTQ